MAFDPASDIVGGDDAAAEGLEALADKYDVLVVATSSCVPASAALQSDDAKAAASSTRVESGGFLDARPEFNASF